ncbi:MAG: hypothetical protein V2I46_06330 [Bacteroides sp.]|jgi:hypothetical protein|nr:hypothetical protein [Bacteroides sp.]
MNWKIGFKALAVIAFGIISTTVYSQEENHNHDHHKYELGLANSLVYFAGEKEFAYGLHIHLVRNINHSKFGLGLAYERIFDEHKHNSIGVVASYNPLKSWHINIAPGIAFEDAEPSDLKFAFHAETIYDFDIGNFHIGPLLDFAVDPEDYHFSFGLHIGYGF